MKNYLIVGASSGIGLAVTESLVNKENNVFTLSRNLSEPLAILNTNHQIFDMIGDDLSDLTNFLPDTLHGLAQFLLNSEKKIEASIERHPLKKIGDPRDLAKSVSFLLTEQSSWINGQILHVDGGLSSLKVL